MQLASQRLVLARGRRIILPEQPPQSLDKARAAFNSRLGPRQVTLGRAVGQHEPAHRIGAVIGNDVFGVDDVLLRLGHLDDLADLHRQAIGLQRRAIAAALDFGGAEIDFARAILAAVGLVRDHALREEAGERLLHLDRADMRQCARPETGVEQVQDRVFDPADILLHRQPLRHFGGIKRLVGRLAGKAQEIPAGIDESVERIGLAPRGLAALRAIDMLPGWMAVERVAGDGKVHILGQHYRQLILGHRNHAAAALFFWAMDEGDRRAPITLARHAPVAQAPYSLSRAAPLGFDPADDFGLGLGHAHAVEEIGIDADAIARLGLGQRGISLNGAGGNHAGDRQAIFGGEFEIALVMPRHRHHRARAVFHQHEIGDVDGQVFAGEGVLRADSGIEAQLFRRFQLRRSGAALLAQVDELCRVAIDRRNALRQRMIRGHGDKAGTEDRIGPRGVDRQAFTVRQVEGKLQALALADPVFLHHADLFRPAFQRAQPCQQIVGKLRDLEEPLVELALFHQCARAPAAPVHHLFVGEHRLIDRIPVHRAFAAIDKACGIQIEEQRLFVPVIAGIAGGDLAAPVEREAQLLQLPLHRGDVVVCPAGGVDSLFHRRVFGGHAKGVPAHRVQHFKAVQLLVARQHIAHRVIAHMADMDPPRWIGEHLQHIALGLRAGGIGLEAAGLVPGGLPTGIGLPGIKPDIETRIGHGNTCALASLADGRTAQIARLGQDDVFQPLHSGSLHRCIHPHPVAQHLPAGGNAHGIGAQIGIKDRDRDLHPLAGAFGIGVPVGHDHPASTVGLGQRHEGERFQAGAPEIGIDPDIGHLRGGQIGHRTTIAAPASGKTQHAGAQQRSAQRAPRRKFPVYTCAFAGNGHA